VSFPAEERRRYQRAVLVRPHAARAAMARVYVMDISLEGVRIAHQGTLPAAGRECVLEFDWEGNPVSLRCEVTRNILERLAKTATEKSVYHAGLRIVDADQRSRETLRTMIAALVARALDEQKANARGIPAEAAQMFQTGKGSEFLRFELINGAWRRTATTRPEQPAHGFTISANEDRQHIEMLCHTFQNADEPGRKLIKQMAELSISKTEGIPTRRYQP
jgi:PilZ domain